MKNNILILILFLLYSHLGQAGSFSLGERVTVTSKILSTDRELQVLVPENYDVNSQTSYPVIYLLDGDYNFHGISGMLDSLASKGQLIPEVILVGIADKGTSQYRNFMTPSDLTPGKPSRGQAAKFLSFIKKEVQPFIDKNYRAANHSTLIGQSMGGLFVLNALIEEPELFSNYIAVSPSVWVDDQGIVGKAKDKLGKTQHAPINIFLSLADETRMGVYDLLNTLDINEPRNVNWSFKQYADESHNSIGLIAVRDALKVIYQAWHINEKQLSLFKSPTLILEHYQTVMTDLDFNQAIPTGSIKAMIKHFYRQKLTAELPEFIDQAIKRLPASKQAFIAMQASYVGHFESPKAALVILKAVEEEFSQSIAHLKAIAGTYAQVGNKRMAYQYYKKALVVAKKQKANQWQLNIINAKLLTTQ
jgi:predicted alpha/beta superfamily hydrolase